MSHYSLIADNATILSFLNDWITEELLILISDSEDTTSLIRFDLGNWI